MLKCLTYQSHLSQKCKRALSKGYNILINAHTHHVTYINEAIEKDTAISNVKR